MLPLSRTISLLRKRYGSIDAPPAEGPFALVMWENACYLLPDERRREVFESLRDKVGMTADAIHGAPDEKLLPLARRGGMRPEMRVFRWREIARITLQQFGGDLNLILNKPHKEAMKALKQFPNIGDPAAEKILLFCGKASGLPLESNGLRTMVRLGWAREQANYGRMYRDVRQNLATVLPRGAPALQEAFLLLREHGRVLCKDKNPRCEQCPLVQACEYARQRASTFLLPIES